VRILGGPLFEPAALVVDRSHRADDGAVPHELVEGDAGSGFTRQAQEEHGHHRCDREEAFDPLGPRDVPGGRGGLVEIPGTLARCGLLLFDKRGASHASEGE